MTKFNALRRQRPNYREQKLSSKCELCCDAAQCGLVDEVRQLYVGKNALEEKLKQVQHAFHDLYKKLHHLNENIALKTQSLRLDNHCLECMSEIEFSSNDTNKEQPQSIDNNQQE
uniref:Tektin n=1 Tax=Arion vulgaris TaxID=1028688 RepID=A0A0B6ZL75_9EUPU